MDRGGIPVDVAIIDGTTPVVASVTRKLNRSKFNTLLLDDRLEGDVPVRIVVAGGKTRLTSEFWNRLPDLQLVVRTGAGYENVELAELRRRDVFLLVPRVQADTSVPEYVLGAALWLVRDLRNADRAARAAYFDWRDNITGRSLADLALGIVGLGRTGRRVGVLGNAFGMQVMAWNPWSAKPDAQCELVGTLDELLTRADIVSLHCQLTAETRYLLNDRTLSLMRPGSVLVNAARWELIEEEALVQALASGHLGGAAIDGFGPERNGATTRLSLFDNVILTPHIAGLTVQSVDLLSDFVVRNVTAFGDNGVVADPEFIIQL